MNNLEFLKSRKFPLLIATVMLVIFSVSSAISYFSRETMTVDGVAFVAYENKEHGFRFFYPEDWLFDEPRSTNVVTFLATKPTTPIERGFFIVGIEKPADSHKNLADYSAETLKNLEENIPDFTLLESNDVTFGGKPAHAIVQTATVNGHSIKSKQVWYIQNESVYNVSYSASVYFYSRYEPIAQTMFESFQVE